MEKRFEFRGTGGQLLVKFIVGMLLTSITLGIYMPWFLVSLWKYVADNTTLSPTNRGKVRFRFTGTGGELFVVNLVGGLLCMITFGIYMPWFLVKLTRYVCQNTSAKAEDGTIYRLRFMGTGGSLAVTYLIGMLLCMITFFLYGPWFMCSLQKYFAKHTRIYAAAQKVGSFDFVGTGGELLVTYLIGMLLCIVTLGIYQFWFQVSLFKFFSRNSRVSVEGGVFAGDFHGTGLQYLLKLLLGGFLTGITCGIYGAWFFTNLLKWQLHNTTFGPLKGRQPLTDGAG